MNTHTYTYDIHEKFLVCFFLVMHVCVFRVGCRVAVADVVFGTNASATI